MQVQAPVSSALQGRRPNGRYGCDRTGQRRGSCHCRHERVQAVVGENWRQYCYLSGSSIDLEGVRIATPPNVTRAMIRRYQYHQPGALAEGGGQALEDAVVPDIVETFPNVQIRAVRSDVLLPRIVEKGQRAHSKRCLPLQSRHLDDLLSLGAHLAKKYCFIKLNALSTLLALPAMLREGHWVNRMLNVSVHPNQ